MKYVVILGDGMADHPVEQLNGKTPLQVANKPNIDMLAANGLVGMVKTIPDGVAPGSDSANLSVLGYDPRTSYSGRSPIEAISMGVDMKSTDVAFRCNLVTLSDNEKYEDKVMLDYSSDEISTQEAKLLMKSISDSLKSNDIEFYVGMNYRHCMIQKNGDIGQNLTPPHDILEKCISLYLPKNQLLYDMMLKSYDILKNHPINTERIARGLKPANSIWLWGEGRKPILPKFYDKYGIRGSIVSAVDLVKGIGILSGLKSIDVVGATGNINTNYEGKVQAAVNELKNGQDFVYLHIEAPDECGHRQEIYNKVKSIEFIDEKIVKPLLKELDIYDNYRIMILPDHATPLRLRTHTSEPVPFIIYEKNSTIHSGVDRYDEETGKSTGVFIDIGHTLMDNFFKTKL